MKTFFLLFISFILSATSLTQAYAAPDSIVDSSPRHDEPEQNPSKPISFDFLYLGDGVYGFNGPFNDQTTLIDNLLLNLTLDNEKLLNIKGNSMFFTYIGIWGGSPNQIVGSAQGFDNIENNFKTARLYQAWTNQKLFGDRLELLVGLYDYNSEFDVTDSALVFILPALGLGTEVAQTGLNGPSTYPTTSFAARVKVSPSDNWYMMLAGFDGVPGNVNNQYGTHVDLVKRNGIFWALEDGVNFGPENKKYKFAVGAWYYTSVLPPLFAPDGQKVHNQGVYGTVDIPIYRVSSDSKRGVNFFLRPGLANDWVNQFSPAIAGGLHWQGPFAKRLDDEAGIAFAYAKSTNGYMLANAPTELMAENQIEATYALKINDYLVMQPTLQWILPKNRSSIEPAESSSVLGLLRIKVANA